jgi:hypothetical protein
MDPMGLSLYVNGVSVCESHGLARQIMQVLNKIKTQVNILASDSRTGEYTIAHSDTGEYTSQ